MQNNNQNISAPPTIAPQSQIKSLKITKKILIQIINCISLSIFYVVFIWEFWNKGIFALGINASFYLLGIIYLFSYSFLKEKPFIKQDIFLLFPLILIAVSFSLFENPFIKFCNILIFPILFIIIFNYLLIKDKEKKIWNSFFLSQLIARFFLFFNYLNITIQTYLSLFFPKKNENKTVIKKIFVGLFLFFTLAGFVVIPLLSAVDNVFAGKMGFIYTFIQNLISTKFVNKIIAGIVLSIFFLANLIAWKKEITIIETEKKSVDSIISGIVLGGVLTIYLLFIWIQFERFFISSLPNDFKETEILVKNGFWQLLILSIINIAIFYGSYQKTNKFVQKLLVAFTTASFLLLSSAGYRMWLYVNIYGFSYEKFYAFYTIIFCTILFIYLISRFLIKNNSDIVKFLFFLFIWMYAIITIFPVDSFIFKTNIKLSKKSDSKINLFELTTLSSDILPKIYEIKNKNMIKNSGFANNEDAWNEWMKNKKVKLEEKSWYEYGFSNLITKQKIKN